MRLAKYLASAGVSSRRRAEQLVREGRVAIRGVTVTDPARDVDSDDPVTVDDQPLQPPTERVVYALNKPAGVVSTASDTHGRSTVVSLVSSSERLYPVGRLDIDTTGLILLTNDGDLAYRLTHPRFEVPKTYRARVGNGRVGGVALRRLRDGVELDDGRTAPARVKRVASDTLELTIHEGRKRQVRRMCEQVGHPVKELRRVRFGPLELGSLPLGEFRRLSAQEVDALSAAGGRPAAPAARRRAGASQ